MPVFPKQQTKFRLFVIALISTGLAGYTLFFLYPAFQTFNKSRHAITMETAGLDEMKTLFPVQARVNALEKIQFSGTLPFPRRSALHRRDLPALYARLAETAAKNRMTLSNSDVDINSLDRDSQSLSVMIILTGEWPDFRQFLIDTIALDFFTSVRQLQIRAGQEKIRQFILTLNLKINKAGHE